ncbi:MAG: Na-K-Cl cotransporter [Acidobacteriota bacterium]|nr:Na-K-Cl cotransporter [Acidobacteriota bacterium]
MNGNPERIPADAAPRTAGPAERTLGTFLGVFTPSILTILGVILYLRTGWVVGNVGLLPTLVIVVVANLITLATALSLSAVATNMHIGAGGAYYIISRSLGIEIGVAIGIPLFLAQTFSVTLYAFGLAESLQLFWPHVPLRPVAAVTVIAVSLLAARSARLALKLQLPIMAAIGVSLLVLVIGVFRRAQDSLPLLASVDDAAPFWTVFAVFFPAVTGIMAGVSLSGDLKNPNQAIPRGTISAVLVGLVVYALVPVGLALAATPDELVKNNLVWFTITGGLWLLILPGLLGAIFSSAVGSMLGAPRTLEALVADRALPRFLAGGARANGGAGAALLISAGVALLAVGLGNLNAVAPVLTMFFLTTYGMVNLVAGLEQLSGDPSYRPTLRIPWIVSLAGAAACFWVMFLISKWACILAIGIEIGIWLMVRRRAMSASWGDLRRGALVSLVRATVLRLRRLPQDPRSWRPHILLFAEDVERHRDLIQFASWLNQERGILTMCRLVVGRLEDHCGTLTKETAALNRSLEEMGLTAFGEIDIVSDLESGTIAVSQANGIAGIASNAVMFGWSDRQERLQALLRVVGRLALLGKSTIICRAVPRSWSWSYRHIHVWWGGLQQNGDLLLLFAHLLSLNKEWRSATIRVKSIATNEMMLQRTKLTLDKMIKSVRIDARPEVILKPEGTNIQDLIHEESRGADVVLMGIRETAAGQETEYAKRLGELVRGLPTVILVRNAGMFAGELLQTEEQRRAVP